jgi:two-component system, NtrC family, response regulator
MVETEVANVLIVDDDEIMSEMLVDMVIRAGHNPLQAFSLKDGLQKLSSGAFDVVFLDVRLPDGNGLDALPTVRGAPSSPEVIIVTGYGEPDGAELAMKNGVWDYIQKPASLKDMTLVLARALQYRAERKSRTHPTVLKREGIVGNSLQLAVSLNMLAQAVGSEANVLITGETGTGKELFARAIHSNSRRANRSFVVVDCTSLPETLVESTLFGHEKGAFTGADRVRDGLVKQADGGTLFLDEVGELSMSLQKSFLRVLQDHRFRPLGSRHEIESDFRLISATNKDLDRMVEDGLFRKDLLFRLRALAIEIPPLREHRQDIKDLVLYYIASLCERYGIANKGFTPEFLEALVVYGWPGNVRELISTLERAIASAFEEPTLFPKHLPTSIRVSVAKATVEKGVPERAREGKHQTKSKALPSIKDFREAAVSEAERGYLEQLKQSTGANLRDACRVSGLSRARLYALLKKHGLTIAQ